MPLPNTHLIHTQFQAHHRPVANRQMTGWCRIHRPTSQGSTWDEDAGRSVFPAPTLLYDGSCRYQSEGGGSQRFAAGGVPVIGDQPVPTANVRITVPADDIVYQVNDLVTVVDADNNPDLVGRTLTVLAVSGSSISWQRDLSCQLRQPTSR